MQTIEIQKGIRVGFEDLVNGVSRLETSDLEKLADTVNHILDGRKNPSPAAREQELLEELEHVVPEFVKHRYSWLQAKLQEEKILESEHQELLQIVDFMEERALVRVHLMAELAALRQVSLKEVGEQLRIQNLLEDIVVTSYVVSNNKGFWYIVPVDYWVMNHWGQWGILWSVSDAEKGLKFLEIIEKFRVDSKDLRSFFEETSEANKVKLHPQVFADFDKKEFYTTFGEWALENSVLDSWEGIRAEFKEKIPVEAQFWN